MHGRQPAEAGMEVLDLTVRRRGRAVIEDVTFSAGAGRITALLGANGAGKSTTIRAALGLVRPSTGRALFGVSPLATHPWPARTVGVVLDTRTSSPGRSGRDHLRTLAAASGVHPDVDALLDRVGLARAARHRTSTYSLGMRQRLALASALVTDPANLIFDEPHDGLDPEGLHWLRDLLVELRSEGRAVLMSTHHLADVEAVADHLVVIREGRVVASGSPTDLRSSRGCSVDVSDPHRLAALLVAAGHSCRVSAPTTVVCDDADTSTVVAVAARAGLEIHGARAAGRSLEDAYLDLTG